MISSKKIKTTYSSNLKGEDLIPIAADPLAKKFVGTIKIVMLEQKVLYVKVVGMEGPLVNIAHYIVVSEPEDFNIVFNKRMGCVLDEENQKHSTSVNLIANRAYIIPDITTAIEDDDIGVEDQNINKIFVMGEKCNNNLSLEKLLMINNKVKENSSNGKKIVHIYIDGSVINSGSENIVGLAALFIGHDIENVNIYG
ncbi:hypothetical protein C1646_769998 [Rhizophagus diaphanus]|nr:hypothetical protein C1646_769998 [Rhizophagus diaphanus] [Rhizophagus sp. MUCL 43196]